MGCDESYVAQDAQTRVASEMVVWEETRRRGTLPQAPSRALRPAFQPPRRRLPNPASRHLTKKSPNVAAFVHAPRWQASRQSSGRQRAVRGDTSMVRERRIAPLEACEPLLAVYDWSASAPSACCERHLTQRPRLGGFVRGDAHLKPRATTAQIAIPNMSRDTVHRSGPCKMYQLG
ncbi:uncharacterized protein SCHCODRAFT_02526257 [Schizophyllum commune H4-8]|uniref:uncharacterized protein n=1 Tax=Schizophyllum commune (strain H4-8 / FGSC 9210) TaxID=578458 RepID=UPI00215E2535|nr:uncharacterized protein SCHCODRAFT_02526257 [Schizophyllum commune H4-8]KAI5900359.1 hypothetical protein SCHCODRAFT_02526257 [Schizophyllum commune H4-8]